MKTSIDKLEDAMNRGFAGIRTELSTFRKEVADGDSHLITRSEYLADLETRDKAITEAKTLAKAKRWQETLLTIIGTTIVTLLLAYFITTVQR